MNFNKFIVYLGDSGCDNIIDVTTYQDLYLEWALLADEESKSAPKFDIITKILQEINFMDIRSRYNSQRNIEAYVWDTEYTQAELWEKIDYNGDYFQLVKTTAKPYLNTQGKL